VTTRKRRQPGFIGNSLAFRVFVEPSLRSLADWLGKKLKHDDILYRRNAGTQFRSGRGRYDSVTEMGGRSTPEA
jgi:hypothetical protein